MRNRPDITPACWANKPTGTTDVMGRLWWDRPSATIRTEFFKPEKGRYLHPAANRVISHREGARIQSFPDWYLFEGTKIEIARQIGNAVPPLLGMAIAKYVYEHAFASRSISKAGPTDHIFEKTPLGRKPVFTSKSQDKNSGVAAFIKTWPGDETDDELLAALRELG